MNDKEMSRLISETKARLAALDFAELNAAHAVLKARQQEHAEAVAKIDREMLELSRRINAGSQDDGEMLAEALLAGHRGAQAETLAPSTETLRARREALSRARQAIVKRQKADSDEERELRKQALGLFCEATRPLVDAMVARQKALAAEIVDLHAALTALDFEGRGFSAEVRHSRNAVEHGLAGSESLSGVGRFLPVPAEIRQTIEAVAGRTPLLTGKALGEVRRW